jgi:NADPH2:quinone reductase
MPYFPSSMLAIVAREAGGPDVLHLAQRPVPTPGAGEVLLKVLAAGVNRPDVMQRQGLTAPPAGMTDVLGLEVCGEVLACGPGVDGRWMGQRLMSLVPGGGYAPWCVAQLAHSLPVPARLTDAQAAALPEGLFTVWHNLFELGRLAMGETVLVHGGAGGIGTLAVRMAHVAGARVLATVTDTARAEVLRAWGADAVIGWRDEDFVAACQRHTNGNGVNVVLDMVGGDYVRRNLQTLAFGGRHVSLSFMHGSVIELDLATLMQRQLSLHASTMRPQSAAEKSRMAVALSHHVLPLIAEGRVLPRVHNTLPLSEAAAAHEQLESGAVFGKLVLVP